MKKILFKLIAICLLVGCSKNQDYSNNSIIIENNTQANTIDEITIENNIEDKKNIDDFKIYLDELPTLSNLKQEYKKSLINNYSIAQQNGEPGTIACENDDYYFFLSDSGKKIIQINKSTLLVEILDIDIYKALAIAATNDNLFIISMINNENKFERMMVRYELKTRVAHKYDDRIDNVNIFYENGDIYCGINGISKYNAFKDSFDKVADGYYSYIAKVNDGFYYYSDDFILRYISITNNSEVEERINNQNIDVDIIKVYDNELYMYEHGLADDKGRCLSKINADGQRQILFEFDDLKFAQSMIVIDSKIYFSAIYKDMTYILCYDINKEQLYKIDEFVTEDEEITAGIFAYFFNDYIFIGNELYSTDLIDVNNFKLSDYFLIYSLDGDKISFK